MAKCGFCGNEIEKGTGTLFVEKTGKAHHYCSSKCERNADLGRKPKQVRWTQEFRKLKGKIAADVEREALQREAVESAEAAGKKPKVGISAAAVKKLKG